jgi:hypothetical protein
MQMFEPVKTATIPRLGRYGRRRSVLLLRRLLREWQRVNIIVDIGCVYASIIYQGYTADQSRGTLLQYRYLCAAVEPLCTPWRSGLQPRNHHSGQAVSHSGIAAVTKVVSRGCKLRRCVLLPNAYLKHSGELLVCYVSYCTKRTRATDKEQT